MNDNTEPLFTIDLGTTEDVENMTVEALEAIMDKAFAEMNKHKAGGTE